MAIPRIQPQTPLVQGRPSYGATPDVKGFSIDLAPSIRAQAAVQVDPAGFIAEARGISEIGAAAERTGDALFQAKKVQEDMLNLRKEADASMALEQFNAELDIALQKEPDETKWTGIAQQIANKAASTILDPATNPLSPAAREAIQNRLTTWTTRKLAGVEIDSIKTSHARAGEAISAQIMTALNNKDWATAEELAKQGVAARVIDATQVPRVLGMISEQQERTKREADAAAADAAQMELLAKAEADPDAVAAEIATPAWRAGKSYADVANAERIVAGVRAAKMDEAQDNAAIYTAKPVNEQTRAGFEAVLPKGLRPADRLKFVSLYDQMAAERAKADYNTPKAIAGRFGELLDAANAFDLAALGGNGSQQARDAYAQIMMGAHTIPEILRGKITGILNDKWNSRPPTASGTAEEYMDEQIAAMYQNQQLGSYMVTNPAKPSEMMVDPAKQADARQRRYALQESMQRWLEANPNATIADIRKEITARSGVVIREQDAQKVLDAQAAKAQPVGQPNRDTWFQIKGRIERAQGMPDTGEPPAGSLFPPGAQGATGSAGASAAALTSGRVTSYGYRGDETPDRWSSMGIGSFSGTAAINAARRGESHPMQLQAGDIAVSPDKERELKAAGIQPGDTIEIRYADGRTHTGRWMDRTSKSLRGRWDIYSPSGPSGDNDTPVTSFRKL